MRKASTCWMTRGKDVVRRRCRGKGSLQRRGVSSCVQWKVNGTLPPALFPISMHSSHWLADKVQRSTDCFFFPEPPGGVVPRGEGGRCQRIGPVSRPSGPKVRGLRDRFCPLSLHPLAARLGIPNLPDYPAHYRDRFPSNAGIPQLRLVGIVKRKSPRNDQGHRD